jgi:steroid 5-alpha reductase family enzyme
MISIWAIRLGWFLFHRIHKTGKDGRFDALKPSLFRFLGAWTLQGLWVVFTLAAALTAIVSTKPMELGLFALTGGAIWLLGFLIEAIADQQKRTFSGDSKNRGKFIQTGLWSISRHPNYLGEIMLWIGVAVIAFPVLVGWQWLTLTSPFFVALLLIRVSGIPLLEKRADAKWGGQEDYEAYKLKTPILLPWVGRT